MEAQNVSSKYQSGAVYAAPASYSQTTNVQSYPGGQVVTETVREGQKVFSTGGGSTYVNASGAHFGASGMSMGGSAVQGQSQQYSYQTGGESSRMVGGGQQQFVTSSYQSGPTTTTSYQTGPTTTTAVYQAEQSRSVSGQRIAGAEYNVNGHRVVGHEYGEQRVISTSQRVDETRQSIISERFVEHQIRVPKKVIREEVIEKVIIVPEKLVHEEVIEEIQKVREKIIEIAKPIIQEKIIEVPEYEYVERIVEVPERIVQEKIREVAKIEIQERIIEVPKIITQEKIVEVPDIQYREVPYERVVEVPEIREEIVVKQVPVPQYVDKPIAQYVDVEVPVDVERNLPLPVEAVTTFEFSMPRLRPRYTKVTYPVYLPRFIEVPVAQELLNQGLIQTAERYLAQVGVLSGTAASLCEIENLAANIMKADFQTHLQSTDLQSAVIRAWQTGMLQFSNKTPGGFSTTSQLGGVSTQGYTAQSGTYVSGQQLTSEQYRVERKSATSGKKHKKHHKSSRI